MDGGSENLDKGKLPIVVFLDSFKVLNTLSHF